MVNLNPDLMAELECSLLRIRAIGALFCLARGPEDSDVRSIWQAMGTLLVASAEEALEVLDAGDQAETSGDR
ncbi:MAG: hypothetical protein GY807_01820 [Gammaproteobacteria bacterium]|nr:hypothetical protein [Gammaproteobacteria bacterium]